MCGWLINWISLFQSHALIAPISSNLLNTSTSLLGPRCLTYFKTKTRRKPRNCEYIVQRGRKISVLKIEKKKRSGYFARQNDPVQKSVSKKLKIIKACTIENVFLGANYNLLLPKSLLYIIILVFPSNSKLLLLNCELKKIKLHIYSSFKLHHDKIINRID